MKEDDKNYKNVKKQSSDDNGDEKTLKDVIQEQAREDESPLASRLSLRKILGGDILYAQALRRQIGLMLLITLFLILYIANRYSIQQKLIEIDKLQTDLQDAKYKALSSNSQLTEESRESHVLEMLKTNADSTLHIADQPPYIITVPDQK